MSDKIKISVENEIKNTSDAIKRTTKAAFAGSPGVAASIKGKSKTAQFSLKLNNSNKQRSLQSIARREILGKIFQGRAPEIEIIIKKALKAVIAGLVGQGDDNVKVFGRSLGRAKPQTELNREPFARFIKSKEGAGEIGLPDPDQTIRELQIALLNSISIDVIVGGKGPKINFRFDQKKLLKLTPHPDRTEGGSSAPFFSWLSLVTGPDFAGSGTPGYGLVRVKDLRDYLRKTQPREASGSSRRNLRRVNIVEGLIRSSRTHGNAGELAGIMMSTRVKKGGKSPAKTFGGVTRDYKPNPQFRGFWDRWWMNSKMDLGVWSRRIMRATIKGLLES